MITIYNESHKKDKKDDHIVREMIEDFFEEHQYLDFTNILAWIKEANPDNSAGPHLWECSLEARLPNQEPVYVSKKNNNLLNAVKESLETLKDEIIRKRKRIRDKNHSPREKFFRE